MAEARFMDRLRYTGSGFSFFNHFLFKSSTPRYPSLFYTSRKLTFGLGSEREYESNRTGFAQIGTQS